MDEREDLAVFSFLFIVLFVGIVAIAILGYIGEKQREEERIRQEQVEQEEIERITPVIDAKIDGFLSKLKDYGYTLQEREVFLCGRDFESPNCVGKALLVLNKEMKCENCSSKILCEYEIFLYVYKDAPDAGKHLLSIRFERYTPSDNRYCEEGYKALINRFGGELVKIVVE